MFMGCCFVFLFVLFHFVLLDFTMFRFSLKQENLLSQFVENSQCNLSDTRTHTHGEVAARHI